jgi:hypothetical protein
MPMMSAEFKRMVHLKTHSASDSAWKQFTSTMKGLTPILICFGFGIAAVAMAKTLLLGGKVAENPTDTLGSLLMLLLICGFGAVALTFSSVVDDVKIIENEYLLGVGAGFQIIARFVSRAPFGVLMGLIAAVFYAAVTEPMTDTEIGELGGYSLLLIVYGICCCALGLLISSMGRSMKTVAFWIVGVLCMMVAASDIAFELSGLPMVIKVLAHLFPTRYAAGFLGADVHLDDMLVGDNDKGEIWHGEADDFAGFDFFQINIAALIGLTVVYLVLARFMLARRLKKYVGR